MKKKQSHWWRMAWIVITFPLVGLALTAFSKPKEALKEVVDNSVEIIEQPIVSALSAESEEVVAPVSPIPVPAKAEQASNEDAVKAGDLVKGTVKDAAGPMMSANIREVDADGRTVSVAVSDMNGNFAFKVKNPNNKIHITYVGQKEQVLDINSHQLDVMMEENSQFRNVEVVASHVSIDSNDPRYQDNENGAGVMMVEQIPQFPGGTAELFDYMSKSLTYPSVAREMQIEAEVLVKFTVDKTGFVRSPKVISISSSCPLVTDNMLKAAKDGNVEAVETVRNHDDAIEAMKEEAIHMVRNMPRWEPARQNGKRVETTYTLPVSYKLK